MRDDGCVIDPAPVRLVVPKTRLKPMSDEFAQLSFVTGSTSDGSAKVMSTHCAAD